VNINLIRFPRGGRDAIHSHDILSFPTICLAICHTYVAYCISLLDIRDECIRDVTVSRNRAIQIDIYFTNASRRLS